MTCRFFKHTLPVNRISADNAVVYELENVTGYRVPKTPILVGLKKGCC